MMGTYLAVKFVVEEHGDLAVRVRRDDALAGAHQVAHGLGGLDLEYDVLVRLVDQRQPRQWTCVFWVQRE